MPLANLVAQLAGDEMVRARQRPRLLNVISETAEQLMVDGQLATRGMKVTREALVGRMRIEKANCSLLRLAVR